MTPDRPTKRDVLLAALKITSPGADASALPPGITIHAIEQAQSLGVPRRLEGDLIVELPDGSLHRITGSEVSEWNEALAPFIKTWRLPEH